MLKIPLKQNPFHVSHGFPWKSCAPFVENKRGTLIHRLRSAATLNINRSGQHVGISFWCGMATVSDGGHLTLLDAPPEGRIVCEICEKKAVDAGLPSSDRLAGRHVHKGRTKAFATCCDEFQPENNKPEK